VDKLDDRLRADYWPVYTTLTTHYGPKLPLKDLFALIQLVCKDHPDLHITRDASRSKDRAVGWLCRNWGVVSPILPEQPVYAEEQANLERELRSKNWETACAIEQLFASLPKTTPGKARKPLLTTLRKVARQLAATHKLALGHLQKRNEKLLIAWYAEHWTLLEAEVRKSEVLTRLPPVGDEGAQAEGPVPMINPGVVPLPTATPPVMVPEGAIAPVRAPNARIVPDPVPELADPPEQPVAAPGVPPTNPLMDNAESWKAFEDIFEWRDLPLFDNF
jgi:hypothetical protein